MTHNTEIQWTHVPGYKGETWNPWTGCTKVSPGCANCYIEDTPPFRKEGKRFVNGKIPITIYPDRFRLPIGWKKPRGIFVNSMSDLFHEDVPIDDIAKIFAIAALAPRHIYMVLTKRPERMKKIVGDACFRATVEARMHAMRVWLPQVERTPHEERLADSAPLIYDHEWPLRSVWLGVTIENRRHVGRADLLRQTPAAVRFISAEPLLGPLLPDATLIESITDVHCDPSEGPMISVGAKIKDARPAWTDGYAGPGLDLDKIDWIITGGESGSRHRRFEEEWALAIRDAAAAAGVAFFHKQHGGRTPKAGGRLLDDRTYDEFPALPPAR